MMSLAKSFPQFSRFFSAKTLAIVARVLSLVSLVSIGCALFVFNSIEVRRLSEKASPIRDQVLSSPLSAVSHMKLAQVFKASGQQQRKDIEVTLAKDLLVYSGSPAVLGVSNDIQTTLSDWETEPSVLKNALQYWKSVILLHPDYRDAYLQAGYVSNLLGDKNAQQIYLNKAKELDPLSGK